jgi:hypothetical protein
MNEFSFIAWKFSRGHETEGGMNLKPLNVRGAQVGLYIHETTRL